MLDSEKHKALMWLHKQAKTDDDAKIIDVLIAELALEQQRLMDRLFPIDEKIRVIDECISQGKLVTMKFTPIVRLVAA